ncbi:MAG: transposase [Pyrinomonadaceae bacterium]|nr:transposase [Pyrinomonadaceae bacterium]
MQLTPVEYLSRFGQLFEGWLFPRVEEEVGPLGRPAQLLVQVLSMAPLDPWLRRGRGPGRPPEHRHALAAAFIAKAVYNFVTTRQLMEQLRTNTQMRRLCGWQAASELPHESTFSRAFADFATTELPQRLHEALIIASQGRRLIGHISRDATAIEARERFPEPAVSPQKKGRRVKYRKRPKQAKAAERGTQIERQRHMKLAKMLSELPRQCAIGVKKSSKGYTQCWRGYKLHLDVADGQIPISAILTGANVHDATVAIPLMRMSAQRVTWLYDLMDSAYDADAILEQCRAMNHVPIVDPHPRRAGKSKSMLPKVFPAKAVPELTWAQQDRFKERATVERVYARLKDEFGGRHTRVRGPAKVFAHLGFGLLALTVDQLLKLTG